MDISALSTVGRSCVKRILFRSSLEYLCVVCTDFNVSVSDSISRVVDSAQWSSIKSLVLSGNNINRWIELWPSNVESVLLSLKIHGDGLDIQELSHSIALFIHQLLYKNSLTELVLQDVQIGWALIAESVDPWLTTFYLCQRSKSQLISNPEAVDLSEVKDVNTKDWNDQESNVRVLVTQDEENREPSTKVPAAKDKVDQESSINGAIVEDEAGQEPNIDGAVVKHEANQEPKTKVPLSKDEMKEKRKISTRDRLRFRQRFK